MPDHFPDGQFGPRLPLPDAQTATNTAKRVYQSIARHGDQNHDTAAHTGWVTYSLLRGGTWRTTPDYPLPGPLHDLPNEPIIDPLQQELWVKPHLLHGLWKPLTTLRDTLGIPTFRQLLADIIDEDPHWDTDIIDAVFGAHDGWNDNTPLPPPHTDAELIASMAGVDGRLQDRDPYILVTHPPQPPDITAEMIVSLTTRRDEHPDSHQYPHGWQTDDNIDLTNT